MRPWSGTARRVAAVVAAVLGVGVATAPPAAAHTVGGVAATDYQSRILGLSPPTPGITVRLLDLGRRIQLTNRSPSPLLVLGYQGEPYLQIGPDGVFENMHSPAVYQNRPLAAGVTSTTLPPIAQPSAAPDWRRTGSGDTAVWRDRRTRWEGPRPAVVARHPGQVATLASWAIPMLQGTASVQVLGRIAWFPPPNPLPWVALAVVLLAASVAVGRSSWWGYGLAGLLAVLVAADAARSYAAALISGGSTTTVLLHTLLAGSIGGVLWVLGALGVAQLELERERGLLLGALAGVGIGLFSGLSDAPYLVHSQLPAAIPAGLTRAGVGAAVGLGFGLATACVMRFRRPPVRDAAEAPRRG